MGCTQARIDNYFPSSDDVIFSQSITEADRRMKNLLISSLQGNFTTKSLTTLSDLMTSSSVKIFISSSGVDSELER